jgi:hypothetical protein
LLVGVALLISAAPGHAADTPALLVLPLDMVDTSGETPSRASEHEARLAALTAYLSHELETRGLYVIVDPGPIGAEIAKVRATQSLDNCNGCERDLARLAHADRVLTGEVDKVSTLIGSLRLSIVDVATGQSVFRRALDFRGDTDDAWRHAARFFARDLEASAAR